MDRNRMLLAAWITLVWTFTLGVGALTGDWLGAQIASPVMVFVAGYYFGSEVVSRWRGKDSREEDDRWSHMP